MDKFQLLHDKYQDVAYGKRNRLDGVFAGMMRIYGQMYDPYMPRDKEAKIIDIACGAGQFVRYCLNKGYENVVGVDLSISQVSYCESHVPGKVKLVDGLAHLADNPNTYDLVVANDFIEHLTSSKGIEFAGLVHHALKDGGRVILKTANMAAFGGIVMRYNTLDHETGYTEVSLESLLGIWGFKDIKIIEMKPTRPAGKLVRKLFNWILRQMYKNLYMGNYPKVYSKIIAVTGVK